MTVTLEMLPQFDRQCHGSLYDRGGADSWYSRERDPHWYPNGTGFAPRMTALSDEEIAEYNAGYDWNEKFGGKKDYD